MPQETLGKDINGAIDYSLAFPDTGKYTTLAANTEQTCIVPPGYNRAFFSYSVGTNVFVGTGGSSISLPSGSFADSTVELNPSVRQIQGGQTLRFISGTTAYVQISFRRGEGSV